MPPKGRALPRVLIDARMVGPTPHGFGRYVSRLAAGLSKRRSGLPYEPVFIVAPDTPHAAFRDFASIVASSRFLSPKELVEIPRILMSEKAGLFHSPTFSSLPYCPCPAISTVHDLNHLKFGGAAERFYYVALLRPFFRKARAKLTVSEFSRDELVAWTGVSKNEIEVVYNALDSAYSEAPADLAPRIASFGVEPGRYFLCLSNPKPHKNIPFLVGAYADYRKSVRAGEKLWPLLLSLRLSEAPELADQPGVTAMGPVSDEDSRALVHGAGAVVFPSLYEGFGLPPVEAIAAGVPVLSSDIPPHREGLRDVPRSSVRFLHARDREGWAGAMAEAMRGGLARPDDAARAAILERFSVERLGEHMDRIYRRVLGI